ncbi:DinB family protein [bacterium]|nr:DinB family protein [bacterium]
MYDVIKSLYDYNSWAMTKLFNALETAPDRAYEALGCSGHGSIRDTLAHMLQTQLGWFSWFDGSLPPEQAYAVKLTDKDIPTIQKAKARWEEIDKQTHDLLDRLNEEKLAEEWSWKAPNDTMVKQPLGQLLLHVVNHSIHTRAQIVSAIRRCGHAPGIYDYLWFIMGR